MASPEPNGEVSLWIKLLIWALVLSAGIVYLRWVYEQGREPKQAQVQAQVELLIRFAMAHASSESRPC